MSSRKSFPILVVALFCLALLSSFAFVTPAHAQEEPMSEDQIAELYGVENFDALPFDLVPGQPVHLSWTVTNANYVEMWRRDVDGTMTRLSTGSTGDGPDYPPGNSGTIMYELRMTFDPGQGWGSNFRYVNFIESTTTPEPTPQPTPEPTPAPETCPLSYKPNSEVWDSSHMLFAPAITGGSAKPCTGGGTVYEPKVTVGAGRLISAGPLYSVTVQVGNLQSTVGVSNSLTLANVDELNPYNKKNLGKNGLVVFCDKDGQHDKWCPDPSLSAASTTESASKPFGISAFNPFPPPVVPPNFPMDKLLEIWKHIVYKEYVASGAVLHPSCDFPVYQLTTGLGPFIPRSIGKCLLTMDIAPLHPIILGNEIGMIFVPLGSDGGYDQFPASKEFALTMATNQLVVIKLGDILRSQNMGMETVKQDVADWVEIFNKSNKSRMVQGEVPVSIPGQTDPVWATITVKTTEAVATVGSIIDIAGQYANAGWQFATSFTYTVVLLPDPSCGVVDLNGDGWTPFSECYYPVNQ